MPKDFDNIRTYNIEGRIYPSVTTVLGMMDKSGPLIAWAAKSATDYVSNFRQYILQAALENTPENGKFDAQMDHILERAKISHRKKSEAALEVGSRVHDIVEKLGSGEKVYVEMEEERVRNGVEAWRTWMKEHNYKSIKREMVVWSHELGVAGTLDDIGLLDNKLAVVDYKTSKALYDEYLIQAAVYAKCYEEMHSVNVEEAWIIRFDKETGEPEEREVTYREEHLECFKGLKKAFDWRQFMKEENKRRKKK